VRAQPPRPSSVTILALLAGLACLVNGAAALLFFGAIPLTILGRPEFFGKALLGAIGCTILALVWAWIAGDLWNLGFQSSRFLVAFALANVIFGVIALIGSTPWLVVLPGLLASVLILVLSVSSGAAEQIGPPGPPAS
jgi:hypothetical protein